MNRSESEVSVVACKKKKKKKSREKNLDESVISTFTFFFAVKRSILNIFYL